jgi:hypothetical protein
VIDLFDLFDIYQNAKIDKVSALQADSHQRLTGTQDRLRELEQRYERMKLVTAALWQLLKAHTGLTDADLKQYIEKVDLADGKLDGKIARKGGAIIRRSTGSRTSWRASHYDGRVPVRVISYLYRPSPDLSQMLD